MDNTNNKTYFTELKENGFENGIKIDWNKLIKPEYTKELQDGDMLYRNLLYNSDLYTKIKKHKITLDNNQITIEQLVEGKKDDKTYLYKLSDIIKYIIEAENAATS